MRDELALTKLAEIIRDECAVNPADPDFIAAAVKAQDAVLAWLAEPKQIEAMARAMYPFAWEIPADKADASPEKYKALAEYDKQQNAARVKAARAIAALGGDDASTG